MSAVFELSMMYFFIFLSVSVFASDPTNEKDSSALTMVKKIEDMVEADFANVNDGNAPDVNLRKLDDILLRLFTLARQLKVVNADLAKYNSFKKRRDELHAHEEAVGALSCKYTRNVEAFTKATSTFAEDLASARTILNRVDLDKSSEDNLSNLRQALKHLDKAHLSENKIAAHWASIKNAQFSSTMKDGRLEHLAKVRKEFVALNQPILDEKRKNYTSSLAEAEELFDYEMLGRKNVKTIIEGHKKLIENVERELALSQAPDFTNIDMLPETFVNIVESYRKKEAPKLVLENDKLRAALSALMASTASMRKLYNRELIKMARQANILANRAQEILSLADPSALDALVASYKAFDDADLHIVAVVAGSVAAYQDRGGYKFRDSTASLREALEALNANLSSTKIKIDVLDLTGQWKSDAKNIRVHRIDADNFRKTFRYLIQHTKAEKFMFLWDGHGAEYQGTYFLCLDKVDDKGFDSREIWKAIADNRAIKTFVPIMFSCGSASFFKPKIMGDNLSFSVFGIASAKEGKFCRGLINKTSSRQVFFDVLADFFKTNHDSTMRLHDVSTNSNLKKTLRFSSTEIKMGGETYVANAGSRYFIMQFFIQGDPGLAKDVGFVAQ